MTNDDLIFRHRVRLFARAGEVGVGGACRELGYHRSWYYRWKPLVERHGLEILMPRERRRPRTRCRLPRAGRRRVVVRTNNGHQTPILTSLAEVPAARVAVLMFARWWQENVFSYMKEHLGLDQLLGYSYQEADGSQLVPNPARHQVERELKEERQELAKLRAELGQAVLDEPRDSHRTDHGLKIAQKGQVRQMRPLEAETAALREQRSSLPAHVPLEEAGRREVLRLEQKAIIDRVKMTAYNAEEWLLERLAPHYPNPHDIRLLLRSFAELSGEIRSTAQVVVVALDRPDTPLHRRALRGLCADLTQLQTPSREPTYPSAARSPCTIPSSPLDPSCPVL